MSEDLRARVLAGFAGAYGGAPALLAHAPGRVNLIGEHTDYNDGFVLPCAIDRGTIVAARPRADRTVNVAALDLGARDSFALGAIARSGESWANYPRGVAALLAGETACGADIAIAGDVPQGAGLSSSASLEVAFGAALAGLWGIDLPPTELARIAQRAENDFAGCACGIMDQLVSARGRDGAALLIDCRSLDCTPVPMPAEAAVLIAHSRVARGLADSAYNERRRQCAEAARHCGVAALRDLDLAALEARRDGLDPLSYARARHVVTENQRTIDAAAALSDGDLTRLGVLMAASHASMRDDFAITVPAIDNLVSIAAEAIGAKGGARMTGGGFGGCVVAVLPRDRLAAVGAAIEKRYRSPDGLPATLLVARPSAGVRLI